VGDAAVATLELSRGKRKASSTPTLDTAAANADIKRPTEKKKKKKKKNR
jgi:hypothetical protein